MNRDQVGVNRNSFSVAQHERFLSKQFRKFRFSRAPGLLFPQREIVRCLSKAVFGVPRRANARRAPDERRYESGAGFAPVFMHIRLAKLAGRGKIGCWDTFLSSSHHLGYQMG